MDELAELRRARALLERGWTQNVCARNAKGEDIDSDEPTAVAFCPVGAMHSGPGRNSPERIALLTWLGSITGSGKTIAGWNDEPERTKEEVLALFDRAIAIKSQNPDEGEPK